MQTIVEKERELLLYLEEWIASRYSEWDDFYHDTVREKSTGIYRLENGNLLMDLLDDILGNLEGHFAYEKGRHIIPSCFSSIPQTLQFLDRFNNHLKSKHYLIEKNLKGENTDQIVFDIYKMCYEIDQMVTRCLNIYQSDDSIPIPYQQAKSALNNNNVKLFVELVGSLIKNVPYNIHKEKIDEGYFHTIIHVITAVLGMSPTSEAETNDGRIDMMIEFPSRIFITEFKYANDNIDRSQEALEQIKKNEYAKAYFIKGKPIECIGMTFSKETRNVTSFVQEKLYSPQISMY